MPDRPVPFAVFTSAHGPALLRLATALTGDPRTARDGLQRALGRAWAGWRRIGAALDPADEVRRLVVGSCVGPQTGLVLAALRTGRRHRNALVAGGSRRGATTGPDDKGAAGEELAQRLAGLPARQRAVVVLRHGEGLPEEWVADLLGCLPATVRAWERRARARLREHDPATLALAVGVLTGRAGPPVGLVHDAATVGQRVRTTRRRLLATAAAAAGVVTVVAAGPVVTSPEPTTGPLPDRVRTVEDVGPDLPDGFHWVSAYGVELAVPSTWASTADCRETGPRLVLLGCPDAVGTDRVLVRAGAPVPGQGATEREVDGRRVLESADGDRLDVVVLDPASGLAAVGVSVMTADDRVRRLVADTVHLPVVDHAGCRTQAPSGQFGVAARPATVDLFGSVRSGSLCVYDPRTGVLLGSRGTMLLDREARLLRLLREAAPTGAVDCAGAPPTGAEGWVHLVQPDGSPVDVVTRACGPGQVAGGLYVRASAGLDDQFTQVAVAPAPA